MQSGRLNQGMAQKIWAKTWKGSINVTKKSAWCIVEKFRKFLEVNRKRLGRGTNTSGSKPVL